MNGRSTRRIQTLFALTLVLASCSNCYSQGLFLTSCREDSEIDTSKREAVDSVALNFVQSLLGPNATAAYGMLSEAGRREVPSEQALEQAAAAIQGFKPRNVNVQHAYLIDVHGNPPSRVVCGTSTSKPEGWESVVAADVPEQAYVLLSAEGINNQFAFTVWLVLEGGGWKVQSFSANPVTLADLTPEQLRVRARTEKARGHNFNAALLYAAAVQTTNRGPNLHLGLADAIGKEMSELSLPPDIKGKPPFEWKSPDMTFEVLSVGPIAVGGKIYVIIQDQSPPWSSNSQIDGWNRRLITNFKQRFPEYSKVFAGIVVRANEKGTNRGFGTVDEVNPAAN